MPTNQPSKFRKKPVVIEAMQYLNDIRTDVRLKNWAETSIRFNPYSPGGEIYDHLHESWVKFQEGDWILRGTQGEFYPCVNAVFEETYEPAS